jgi:hypothetical protein
MDQDVSSSRAANARIHREQALPVATLLALVGGYLAIAGGTDPRRFRQPSVFATICAAFGVGVAARAYVTAQVPQLALGIPVTLLLIALLRCDRDSARSQVETAARITG